MNENIYDGCGIISSELLKKNFEGFEQGKFIPFDTIKHLNQIKNSEEE